MSMGSKVRTAASVSRLLPKFLVLGLLKRLVSLPTLARWAWRAPRPNHGGDVKRIASVVFRTGTIAGLPDRDCLQRSLLLYGELAAAGLQPLLTVGFRRMDGRLTGHAWVSVNGAAVGEPDLDASRFEPVAIFGEGGAPLTGRS